MELHHFVIHDPENLVFSTSTAQNHENNTRVENLSVLFLDEFLKKTKNQFLHGFQKDLNEKVNKPQFIRQSKDFYSTRGTDESFNILFGALYGEKVDIIRPIDDVISPSNANYQKTRDIIVEPLLVIQSNLLIALYIKMNLKIYQKHMLQSHLLKKFL